MQHKMKVIVGLSGGVDSAVSAALLRRSGADVVGAFIKTWQPDWIKSCDWRSERRDAMRVAAHLDIPFITINLEKEYKESVVDYMIAEYKAGRTPNPDVMCNKEVKFGAFLNQALKMGADMIATGHYAQTISPRPSLIDKRGRDESPGELLRGTDPAKDQSYFLWTLNQKQLSKTILPVGHLLKSEVRELAKQFKLPVAEKRDSQGICFLGHIDMGHFLKHYVKVECGNVFNLQGAKIGKHDGAIFYTLGQVWRKPYYVIAKDIDKNTITVSEKSLYTDLGRSSTKCIIKDVNWISGNPDRDKKYEAQIRYHGEKLSCKVRDSMVEFRQPVLVASGQSIVIYDADVCLGGGIVA